MLPISSTSCELCQSDVWGKTLAKVATTERTSSPERPVSGSHWHMMP